MKKIKEFFDKTTALASLVVLVFSVVFPVNAGAVIGTGHVDNFTLVNADTDADITNIWNGSVINIADLSTNNLNIRANTTGPVGSVKFVSTCKIDNGADDGSQYTRTEGFSPYSSAGDSSGDYNPWNFDLGPCTLTAQAWSGSGASGNLDHSRTITVTFYNDSEDPKGSIASPSYNDWRSAFAVTGVAKDADSGVKKVEVFFKAQDPNTPTAQWGYDYKFDAMVTPTSSTTADWEVGLNGTSGNSLPDGHWHIRAVIWDNAGNRYNGETMELMHVDTVKPMVAINTVSDYVRKNVTLTGTASDADAGVERVAVQFKRKSDNKLVKMADAVYTDATGDWSLTVDTTLVNDDIYKIWAVAFDKSVNEEGTGWWNERNTRWAWEYVPETTVDNTKPVVDITDPSASNWVSGNIDVYAKVSDVNIKRTRLRVTDQYGATTTLKNENPSTDYNGVYSPWDTTLFADGPYTLALKAWDLAGNKKTDKVKNVNVDNTASMSVGTLTGVTDGGSTNVDVLFEVNSLDAGVGVDTTEYVALKDGVSLVSSSVPGTYNGAIFTLEGDYVVEYRSTDKLGNVEAWQSVSFTIDKTAPIITIDGDNPVELTVGDTYVEAGATTDDGSAVVVSGTVDTTTAGAYSVNYDSTDAVGNVATQVTRTVNVNEPPVVPVALAAAPAGEEGEDEEVLGETDEDTGDDEDNGDVAGSGNENQDNGEDEDSETAGFFGLAWYWWLLIVFLLGGGYYYYSSSKKN